MKKVFRFLMAMFFMVGFLAIACGQSANAGINAKGNVGDKLVEKGIIAQINIDYLGADFTGYPCEPYGYYEYQYKTGENTYTRYIQIDPDGDGKLNTTYYPHKQNYLLSVDDEGYVYLFYPPSGLEMQLVGEKARYNENTKVLTYSTREKKLITLATKTLIEKGFVVKVPIEALWNQFTGIPCTPYGMVRGEQDSDYAYQFDPDGDGKLNTTYLVQAPSDYLLSVSNKGDVYSIDKHAYEEFSLIGEKAKYDAKAKILTYLYLEKKLSKKSSSK